MIKSIMMLFFVSTLLIIQLNFSYANIIHKTANITLSCTKEEGSSDRFYIDFDGDGDNNFGFYYFYPDNYTRYGEIYSSSNNIGSEVLVDQDRIPVIINADDTITGIMSEWFDTKNQSNLRIEGTWYGKSDKFIAVRFKIGVNYHYGWIGISIPADSSNMTIKDYAYEDIPGKSIVAGNIGTGLKNISEALEPEICLIGKSVFIKYSNHDNEVFNIRIFDLRGNLIESQSSKSSSFSLDFSKFNTGIFFIVSCIKEKLTTKKILIIN